MDEYTPARYAADDQRLRLPSGHAAEHAATACPCGARYTARTAAQHFATVAHAWDDVPRELRGLRPAGGAR